MNLARLFGRSHRLALALWLALLLPLAQAAGVRHELSHLSEPKGTPKLHLTAEPCGLCLAAAAMGGLAPPPAETALALLLPTQAAAPLTSLGGLGQRPLLGYLSRAPPVMTT